MIRDIGADFMVAMAVSSLAGRFNASWAARSRPAARVGIPASRRAGEP
jgi:hypothetical protein